MIYRLRLHKWVYLLAHIYFMRGAIIPLSQINNLCQKMVPRLMPYFLGSAAPEVYSKIEAVSKYIYDLGQMMDFTGGFIPSFLT